MGNISPINGIIQKGKEFQAPTTGNGAQVFSVFKDPPKNPNNEITMPALNSIKKDEVNIAEKKETEKPKKSVPWKKIGLGIAAAAIFIEFNLRRNPGRKKKIQEYTKIFSNTTGTEIRDFNMIPYRDEVLIKEAANGSKKANEIISGFDYDALGIVKYIKVKRKIERARQYYIEGRFEHFKTPTLTNKQIKNKFFEELGQLQEEADKLYEKCIVPLLKSRQS